ncbi:P-loop containing nucleoside triphosphate hydrolase protein [Haematococcus lacustris]
MFSMQSSQGLGQRPATRVACLAPKHASGRVRRALKCQAALTASSFAGQRLSGAAPRVTMPARRSAGRSARLVVKSMFERFTEKAIKVVMLAQEEARRLGHNFVGTEQLLLGLIGESTGIAAKVLKSMGVNLKDARVEVEKIIGRGSGFVAVEIPFTPRAKRVLEMSLEEARQLGHNYIGTEHILLGLLREGEGVAARVLETLSADPAKIRTQVIRMVGESQETVGAGVGGSQSASSNKLPTLSEYGTNLTQQAAEGKLDPVVGRKPQIERVIQILGRRTKNNPCLIGEPGVGKTAVAEGLAQKITNGDVPETIEGKQVITLDMGLLVAGTKYRGEFEERLKKLMDEIKQNDDIILMIDEVHTLIGAGAAEGAIDAANILKPALARGELQCIGATTLDEYRKHIEKDPALERRFQPVVVPEPSIDETFEILQGLRERYEAHHKLRYTDESLMAAAKFSSQYISDRFLPDKAIDLIDEAGSRVRLRHIQLPEEARDLDKELKQVTKDKDAAVRGQDFEKAGQLRDREMELKAKIQAILAGAKEQSKAEAESVEGAGPTVTEQDIANIVAQWTGIPVEKVSSDETERLIKMEEVLHGRVIGQEEAVSAISRAIRRARVGLKSPSRPIASFIFAGPTGVGKSELAKTLANYYFGSEEAMVRLDMSEFMERHTVSKLIGSPPGYVGYSEGGQLTEAVRRRPYTVVLFDEIEKAHPDVFNMMLQILEDGRLTDSKGRTVDFKNTLIIMTSNVGSSVIEKGGRNFGFFLRPDDEEAEDDMSYGRIKSLVGEELKSYFRPEFLNRLDEIIVFRQLTKKEVKQIADIFLKDVFKRAQEKGIKIEVTDKFKDRLVDEGFNPTYGARPLRRAIMRLIEDCLAERILTGDIKDGDVVIMDVDPDGSIAVLAGDKKMRTAIDATPAGIA